MTEDLILEHLRAVRATLNEHTREFHTLSERMGALETHMVGLLRQMPPVWGEIAHIKQRLSRIETRLDLVDAP